MSQLEGDVQLPAELLLMIEKHLDGHENGLSLVLSGALKGLSLVYGQERSWEVFFTRHISPRSISKFETNNCYWIPGEQMHETIILMKDLQELCVKGTKLSLTQLANILKICHNVTKLDFSYQHHEGLLKALLENPLSNPVVKDVFKKLKCLKISTSVRDAKNYFNDPWVFILKMMSWCQVCTELKVEITHTVESITEYESELEEEEEEYVLPQMEGSIIEEVFENVLQDLSWMDETLQSLRMVKLGPFENFENCVRSRLLDKLFESITCSSVVHLLVDDFYFSPSEYFLEPIAPANMKAYNHNSADPIGYEPHDDFRDLEHFDGVDFSQYSLDHLPNLKKANGIFNDDFPGAAEKMRNFIQMHSNLEYLSVCYIDGTRYVLNEQYKLLKLKKFSCAAHISKKAMDDFVLVYPNIEALQLVNVFSCNNPLFSDNKPSDRAVLSSINFKNLNLLILRNFHLDDGGFLLPMIQQCPKLDRVHLEGIISPVSSFALNLKPFLKNALKLRNLRLELRSEKKKPNISFADITVLLKSFPRVNCASRLKRLCLVIECQHGRVSSTDDQVSLADFLVQFAMKMKHLALFCLVLKGCDFNRPYILINRANQRMAEEVLPKRPALWFYLDCNMPDGVDSTVPGIHYHEMVIGSYQT